MSFSVRSAGLRLDSAGGSPRPHSSASALRPRPSGRVAGASCQASVRTASGSPPDIERRDALSLFGAAALAALAPSPALASAADDKFVGSYLPPYGKGDLVQFVPGPRETPAIRAGTIDPNKPYSFALPPKWRRDPVANIASGNYCQPRCAEPWTEVIFSSPDEGKCQVIISPLVRLINKTDAQLEEIGPPEGLINSFGAYITGTSVEEDDVISATAKTVDGRTYYSYELFAPYGTMPPHGLAVLTTKGDAAILFTVNATDKQWSKNEALLRDVVDSFVV